MTRPIDVRREVIPPLLALVLSLLLHTSLLGLHPLHWFRQPPPPLDTVTVEYLPDPGAASAPDPAPAAAADTLAEAAPQLPPEVQPEDPPAPPPQTAAEAAPPPPTAAPVAPARPPQPVAAPPPPDAPPLPATPATPTTPAAAPPAPAADPTPPAVALQDLMPQAADLRPLARRERLPDPTAAGVAEATLSLGDTDRRYRGYLDSVHAAVDASEKWKEAVLMGGGGGEVVVRITLNRRGQLESVRIARSSGKLLLDNAALEAVQRADIPPFPGHWKIERLHLDALFNYQLVTY